MTNLVKKPTAHMFYGYLGAGKTTIAKKLEKEIGAIRFTHDEWMSTLYGSNPPTDKFAEYHERVTKILEKIAFRCLELGNDIILDDGFGQRSRRDEMRKRIEAVGANHKLYFIKCSDEKMKQRCLKRNEELPSDSLEIVEATWEKLKKIREPLGEDEEYIVIENE